MNDEFNRLANKLGSRYGAVNYIAQEARRRRSESDYTMLESEAISWVLTGNKPPTRARSKVDISTNISMVQDILSEIEDDNVRASVYASYKQSLKVGHLIYCYHESLDEGQQSRVRVLMKMIWYNIKQERRL